MVYAYLTEKETKPRMRCAVLSLFLAIRAAGSDTLVAGNPPLTTGQYGKELVVTDGKTAKWRFARAQ